MSTDPTERAFLDDLRIAAGGEDWPAWDACRLVYADWLADRGDPREILVRAPWRFARWLRRHDKRRGVYWLACWSVRLPGPVRYFALPAGLRKLFDSLNGRQLLHFAPGTLKLLRPGWVDRCRHDKARKCTALTITHMEDRVPGPSEFDAHTEGWAALFRWTEGGQ